MESRIVGPLKSHAPGSGFYESEPFEIPYFNNQKLKIIYVEAEYQPYLEQAEKILQNFLALSPVDRLKDSGIVNAYYTGTLEYGFTKPLNVTNNEDIWNFVTPTEIVIPGDHNGDYYLCVSCECEWEEEHGLQLVFKDGQTLTRASGHDGHLTD